MCSPPVAHHNLVDTTEHDLLLRCWHARHCLQLAFDLQFAHTRLNVNGNLLAAWQVVGDDLDLDRLAPWQPAGLVHRAARL